MCGSTKVLKCSIGIGNRISEYVKHILGSYPRSPVIIFMHSIYRIYVRVDRYLYSFPINSTTLNTSSNHVRYTCR